jgi:hypothetical protein
LKLQVPKCGHRDDEDFEDYLMKLKEIRQVMIRLGVWIDEEKDSRSVQDEKQDEDLWLTYEAEEDEPRCI